MNPPKVGPRGKDGRSSGRTPHDQQRLLEAGAVVETALTLCGTKGLLRDPGEIEDSTEPNS